MIPANDPLIRVRRSRNFRNHVIDGLQIPIELDLQVHLHRARTNTIGDRQISTPARGWHRPGKRGKQRLRVSVRNRQHRDLCDHWNIFQLQALGIFCRGHSGSQWITRIDGIIRDTAALRAVLRAVSAGGKRLALKIAVFVRIGVDQAAEGSVLRRDLGLDAAPGMPVTRNHDGPLHRYAELFQLLVILRYPVIYIDQRRGDVSIPGKRVEGRQLLGFLVGSGIFRQAGLFEFCRKFCLAICSIRAAAIEQFNLPLLRRREEHVIGFDVRLQAKFLELCRDPLGVVLVVRRTDVVRPRRKTLHVGAKILRARDGAQLLFPLPLHPRGFRGIAIQRRIIGSHMSANRGKRDSREHNSGHQPRTVSYLHSFIL